MAKTVYFIHALRKSCGVECGSGGTTSLGCFVPMSSCVDFRANSDSVSRLNSREVALPEMWLIAATWKVSVLIQHFHRLVLESDCKSCHKSGASLTCLHHAT